MIYYLLTDSLSKNFKKFKSFYVSKALAAFLVNIFRCITKSRYRYNLYLYLPSKNLFSVKNSYTHLIQLNYILN